MLKIELPKTLDQMSEREKKKYAKALNCLSSAIFMNDEKTTQKILEKYKLKILNGADEQNRD